MSGPKSKADSEDIIKAECSSTPKSNKLASRNTHVSLSFPQITSPHFTQNTFHSFYMLTPLICSFKFQSKAKKIIHLPEVPENKQYLEALYTVGTVQIGSQIPNNVEDLYVFRTTSEKYEGIDTQVSGLPPFSSWSFELGRGGIPLLIQLSKHLRER